MHFPSCASAKSFSGSFFTSPPLSRANRKDANSPEPPGKALRRYRLVTGLPQLAGSSCSGQHACRLETQAAHCGSAAQGTAGVNLAAIQSCTTWASASVTHCFRPEQAELCVVVSDTQAKENSCFFFFLFFPFQHNQFFKAEYRSED